MTKKSTNTRRQFIQATGAASIIGLAGCLDGEDDNGDDEDVLDDTNGDDDNGEEDMGDQDVEADETIAVGPNGNFVFDPNVILVDPGTTIAFEWESGGHNLSVVEQPEDADWHGVPDTEGEGYVHAHTFDVEGEYAYECEPHTPEMEGAVFVGDEEDFDHDFEEEDDNSDGHDHH